MRFAEAEQQYRDLEDQLLRGELNEEQFLTQVALLRLTDEEGRRWMISGRTGRWLLHDGQQWVHAEPAREEAAPVAPFEVVTQPIEPVPVISTEPAATTVAVPPTPRYDATPRPRPGASRWILGGLLALLLAGCLVGGGITAWVMVFRDLGEPTPAPTQKSNVALIETYTPRPETPTYTPTPTATPSRTPVATDTPIPAQTAPSTPTSSPEPTASRSAAAASPTTEVVSSPVTSPTSPPAAPTIQTYTVQAGETLSEIAARFNMTVEELAEANGITNVALIRAGQVLVIPAEEGTAVALASTPTPTWTPIVLSTPSQTTTATPQSTPTPTATRTPTPTPTRSGPTPTPGPTNTPRPTAKPTTAPAALSGKLAFTVWNPSSGRYDLYVSRIDGSGRNMIGEGFRQPQFRQDGNMIAANGDGAPYFEHLVKLTPSGGELVEVSNYVEDSYPTWSPDGAIVAYSSSSWGDGLTRLGIVNDMFGRQQDWIKVGTTEIRGEYPFWMPDGRVVYNGCDFLGDQAACGLYWVGAGGGNYVRLTTDRSDTAPAGNGSRVAFMSTRDGNWEVYRVNMDGSGLVRLTNNAARDGLPTWSPDGKSIAFVSDRDGGWAIWVMNADGSNQRKLFALGGGYGGGTYDWTMERISWSP